MGGPWVSSWRKQRGTGFPLFWLPWSQVSMGISGWLLYLAQKSIPIGTAYAIWTGIGAAGAFTAGVLMFGDALTVGRFAGVSMIVGGVVILKVAGGA